MKYTKKALALFLALCMMVTSLPLSANATETTAETATDETLTASLSEAKTYIDALTINNSSNDPATVVSNFGTHFTWDNEKRESSKSYLFDWSYYNGVVFEGLEYVYEVTGEETYKDYVIEYMSSLIASNGTWATCANNSSKQCAGYNSTHGADCYKTASLLLDTYEMTGDSRYLTIAETLYADLDTAAKSYSLSNAGNNYRHTWATDPSPDLWLDGLYMILPFRAEYAKYSGDTEELDLIVNRMQWVSDNMYNSSKGLFYHAADSASSNSGTYWLRSIGWYAAAIVDIMDSMEGENLEAMKAQLVKLVDGMKAAQNSSNGMWLNNMAASQSSSNPYETSGTALVCYAVMKAVNNGWLDESYADMAILAFNGICNEKLSGTTLTDICFKGAPGSSNSTFYDNEGKGVGPFIMFYAEVLEYVNGDGSGDNSGETTEPEIKTQTYNAADGTTITVANIVANTLTGGAVSDADNALIAEKNYTNYVAYDLTATLSEGTKATISITVPAEWNATADELKGISVEDGEVIEIEDGTLKDGVYSFEVSHFSAKGVAYTATPTAEEETTTTPVNGKGYLVSGTVYELNTDGEIDTSKGYLIVSTNTGSGYALTNNSGTVAATPIEISGNTITIEDDTTDIEWVFSSSNSSGTVTNGEHHIYLGNNSVISENSRTLTISSQGEGAYRIYRTSSGGGNRPGSSSTTYYYLNYDNGWKSATSSSTVYLYEEKGSSSGEEVNFTITPGAATLEPEGTTTLTGTVTVAGETVALSDCTITWGSKNENTATVSDGTVTGVADGTTNITATLSAVNGTALQENIVLEIPITVISKSVTDAKLTGNTPITTKQNEEPDFSNIKLEVTYEDGTTATITVDNGLVIEGYDISEIGYTYATISYLGKVYGNVRVTVEGNPYEGLEEATDYPEYPSDGAVRIDKTATHSAEEFKNTGVTHVELDVAGISVKRGVDVVIVADVSNSMGWSLENSGGSADVDKLPSEGQETKLNIAMKSASDFADILLADNTGDKTDNTLSFVTFAGYDSEFGQDDRDKSNGVIDSLLEVFKGVTSADAAKNSFSNTKFTSATTSYPLQIADTNGEAIVNGNNRGDTNYDYAFWQTAQTVEAIKAQNTENGQENREVYVIFMTDGAPSHYNNATRNGSAGRQDLIPDSTTQYYNQSDRYNQDSWYEYFSTNANTYAKKVYELVNGNFVGIGFDLAHGGFSGWSWSEEELAGALRQVAHDTKEIEVMTTADAIELNSFYTSLATKIKFAGTSAQVTDTIGSNFTLQMANYSGSGDKTATLATPPSIKVTAYDLYSKTDNITDEDGNDLTGSRTGEYDVLEVVTFNEDGTEAYSDQIGDGDTNIMSIESDGTVIISAFYFTYTKTPEGVETFKWTIGNITDKEIVLAFDAYLKGALEGEAEKGTYYTNEEAVLEYIDINGKYAKQLFKVPHVNWGGASTTIRFYLVNENGEPVNHSGEVIPWANRIYVGEPVNVPLNLNADLTIPAYTVEAAAYVPGEYFLYDNEAEYTVQTASGETITGGITISEPSEDASKTTHDENGNAVTQTGAQTTRVIDAETTYFTWSVVGFGVRYDLSKEEVTPLNMDTIVMDYGKDIQVDVLANDTDIIPEGWSAELVGFVKYNANTDVKYIQANPGSATYEGAAEFGKFSIIEDKVNYTPTKMLSAVQKVFCVIAFKEEANTDNVHYRYNVLNIVPATSVYYETDFAANVFDLTTTGNAWSSVTVDGDVAADGPQDSYHYGSEVYGYDSSYANDTYQSNGSSLYVLGQGVKTTNNTTNYTEAKFSFTGTGFDIISRTGTDEGAIRVDIYSDEARTTRVKSVTVLNKSETNLTLYQVPVVSVQLDAHGTYYVTISVNAAYTNADYPSLNRGGNFHFDAIRIYNPVDVSSGIQATGDALITYQAYCADGESNAQITEVRNILIDANTYDATTNSTEGVAFVDRVSGTDATGVTLAEYTAIGPNNEVYLSNGQGIAFKIVADTIPSSIDIGAKSADGTSVKMATRIASGITEDATKIDKEISIQSSTVQFFELAAYENLNTGFDNAGESYVILKNTGDGILSITDIKIAYGMDTSSVSAMYLFDDDVMEVAQTFMLAAPAADEIVEPNYDILSMNFASESCRLFKRTILKVMTTQDVESLKITNQYGWNLYATTSYEDCEDGSRIWTVKVIPTLLGTQTYTVTGSGADGTTGASASANIKVTLF